MTADKNELLERLRIDRELRDEAGSPRGWWWLAVLVAAVAGAAGAWLLLVRGRAVEVAEVTALAPSALSTPTAVLQASGYVTAEREATVSAEISGLLTHVYIQEGEHVRRGQILARLEDGSQLAALAQAQAQWRAAQALLAQYQAQLAQARLDLGRDQALVARQLVSEQAFEQARTQVAVLAAQVRSQRREAQVDRAAVEAARVQEDYTVVRAPFSGVVVDKAAQMGEMISPLFGGGGFTRTGIATIVDMNSLEVDVDVNEAYIDRVRPGQPAVAVLDAYPHWKIPAHVIAIVPTANKSKATVRVRVALESKDPRILPQMGVRVSFLQKAPKRRATALPAGMVWVPASAVVRRGGRSVLFVIGKSRVRERVVTAGPVRAGLRAVSGIAAGVSLVRSPPKRLRDGERVAIESE